MSKILLPSTVDKGLLKLLNEKVKEKSLNRSAFVERAIEEKLSREYGIPFIIKYRRGKSG